VTAQQNDNDQTINSTEEELLVESAEATGEAGVEPVSDDPV
jgi:hypothetical protein